MSAIESLDREMNDMLREGRILEALEKFSAEDVVLRDHDEGPWNGLFVETIYEVTVHGRAAGDDVSFCIWTLCAGLENGEEMDRRQIDHRKWCEGKITEVEFF